MKSVVTILLIASLPLLCFAEGKTVIMDPNDVQLNDYVHKELPPELLKRIKATTDVFEVVDGTSFEKAVDLYKRDLYPESNLIIWEEMARVYKSFCKSRCSTHAERLDVYRALLLRSMFNEVDALARLKTKIITRMEAKIIVSQYKLKAKPIDVIKI